MNRLNQTECAIFSLLNSFFALKAFIFHRIYPSFVWNTAVQILTNNYRSEKTPLLDCKVVTVEQCSLVIVCIQYKAAFYTTYYKKLYEKKPTSDAESISSSRMSDRLWDSASPRDIPRGSPVSEGSSRKMGLLSVSCYIKEYNNQLG